METTIVLCVNSLDFRDWIFVNYGIGCRHGSREIVIDDNRIIGVSKPEHLMGYRFHSFNCNSVKFTLNALDLDNFHQMLECAYSLCLLIKITPFKFGR
jgi:hypothetical protein